MCSGGDDGFKLGHYHRDAQFYIINCSFADNIADVPVYLNPSNPQNIIQWGERVYYFNSHRQGGDYAWHTDNLYRAPGSPKVADINPNWTFAGQWEPSLKPTEIDGTFRSNKMTRKFRQRDPLPVMHGTIPGRKS